jgi:hypothetical protein
MIKTVNGKTYNLIEVRTIYCEGCDLLPLQICFGFVLDRCVFNDKIWHYKRIMTVNNNIKIL